MNQRLDFMFFLLSDIFLEQVISDFFAACCLPFENHSVDHESYETYDQRDQNQKNETDVQI
jgi:hypothetical protein